MALKSLVIAVLMQAGAWSRASFVMMENGDTNVLPGVDLKVYMWRRHGALYRKVRRIPPMNSKLVIL